MKKLVLAIGLVAILAVPTAQATLQITVDRTGAVYGNNGGEFHVTPNSDPGWANYGITGPFMTFCVETDEYLDIGGSYTVEDISTAAVQGGSGGPSPDPLSIGTSWLFSQYWQGAISFLPAETAKAAEFQNALWALEEESGYSSVASWIQTLLVNNVGADMAAWRANAVLGVSDYGVRVMNLVNGPPTAYGYENQDLLIVVPEPTTILAGALLLLPFAASTIRRFRRTS